MEIKISTYDFLNKFILENVEFRVIHAHEKYVLVKPEHHKKVYPESKELF